MAHSLRNLSKIMKEEYITHLTTVCNFVCVSWKNESTLNALIMTHWFLCAVFDEAALTDDLLVQLVEVLKKHKASSDDETNFDSKTDKKDSSEGKEFWK